MCDKQRRTNCEGDVFCPRKNAWCGNKEDITLIWLTHTNFGLRNNEGENILKQLHEINNYVLTFNDSSACIEHMKLIKNERIFLLVDGKIIVKLYEEICSYEVVDSIYIFCIHHEKYEYLRNHPKIAGIFMHQIALFNALQNGIEAFEKQVLAFSQLDHHKHVLTKDLSRESASFLWFMLLVEVLEAMPAATKEEQTVMLDLCEAYYRNNSSFLADIDKFRHTYTEDTALRWYTKASFIYKLVNKALRVEDIELLYQFRFFIIDLCKQLKRGWLHAQSLGLTEISSTVYRGGKLAFAEVNALIPGQLITINGFLSTTCDIEIAGLFTADLLTQQSNYRAVIFHITVPENLTSLVFAYVDYEDTYFPDEKEVIFNIGACFRVDRVYVDDEKSYLYHIDLTATDDGREDFNAHLLLLKRDLNETKAIYLFGRLLLDLDEINKASNYFQLLLNTTSKDDHLAIATIHSYLGRIERIHKHFDKALSHYYIALQIRQEYIISYHTDLAASHNSLGLVYLHKPDYRLALCHLQRALDIETTLHDESSHTNISKILGHIAIVHQNCGNIKLALEHFQRALSIEQRLLPSQHIYVASRFQNLGLCYEVEGNFNLALEYYQRALCIAERTLPICHKDHRRTLKGILNMFYELGDYSKAIEFGLSILDNDTTLYKGWTMARLSEVHLKIKDFNKASQYFQDASNFCKKNQSDNSPIIRELKEKLKQLEQIFSSNTDDKINF